MNEFSTTLRDMNFFHFSVDCLLNFYNVGILDSKYIFLTSTGSVFVKVRDFWPGGLQFESNL